ncbi:testicular acid phosphatase homolog [Rhipicephalus sanguineus]|uniref:testicular acid phosphatase homolog n=1 Tax=Rhipicephalus sanguineus TaxID=34632 RepID=UPI0018942082|nr:testicular acid phosphatase homolog [Rhipicephalus sanguineus]
MQADTSAAAKGVPAPDNMLYAFVVSRHGQRTPIMCCKMLPKNVPEDHGQLTREGHEQTFKLGLFLRVRYKRFLVADEPDQLLATHVRLQRCRESLSETVRGLNFPTSTPLELDPTRYDLLFQASLIENIDLVLQAPVAPPGQSDFPCIGDLLAFIAEKTGAPTREKRQKFLVMDSLLTYVAVGNPIPAWAHPIWNVLIATDHRMFGLALTGNELWYAENVLGEVVETLSQKFEKGIERPDRLHVFSMSDSSVYSILKLLDTSYDDHPCFCASVIFEVFEDASKVKRVQVLLSTKTDEDPQLVATDKLKNPCELKEFLDFVRGILKS